MNAEQARKAARMAEYSRLTRRFRHGALVLILVPVSLILILLLSFFTWLGYVSIGKTTLCTYETAAGHTVTVTQLGHHNGLMNRNRLLISVDGEQYLQMTVRTDSNAPVYPADRLHITESEQAVTVKLADSAAEVCFSPDFGSIQFIRSVSYTLVKENIPVAAQERIDLH